jgi:hypothetical protein
MTDNRSYLNRQDFPFELWLLLCTVPEQQDDEYEKTESDHYRAPLFKSIMVKVPGTSID